MVDVARSLCNTSRAPIDARDWVGAATPKTFSFPLFGAIPNPKRIWAIHLIAMAVIICLPNVTQASVQSFRTTFGKSCTENEVDDYEDEDDDGMANVLLYVFLCSKRQVAGFQLLLSSFAWRRRHPS